MIKFTKLIRESRDIEEVEDYLLLINDVLGNPIKKSSGSGDFVIHEFNWKFNINLNQYNDASQIDKLLVIFDSIKELKTSKARIDDCDIDFKIDGYNLYVRVTPKSSGNTNNNYKFFIEQSWRETRLSYSEIVRFFKDRGYSITNIEDKDDEYNESNSVTIYTNSNSVVTNEFTQMLKAELDAHEEEIYNDFDIRGRDNYVSIYPEGEKAYVTLVKQ